MYFKIAFTFLLDAWNSMKLIISKSSKCIFRESKVQIFKHFWVFTRIETLDKNLLIILHIGWNRRLVHSGLFVNLVRLHKLLLSEILQNLKLAILALLYAFVEISHRDLILDAFLKNEVLLRVQKLVELVILGQEVQEIHIVFLQLLQLHRVVVLWKLLNLQILDLQGILRVNLIEYGPLLRDRKLRFFQQLKLVYRQPILNILAKVKIRLLHTLSQILLIKLPLLLLGKTQEERYSQRIVQSLSLLVRLQGLYHPSTHSL